MCAAINAASDMNETVSKSNVVFGDAADQVQMFAENAATGLGMSNEQALAAASTYGNLFVSVDIKMVDHLTEREIELFGKLSALRK